MSEGFEIRDTVTPGLKRLMDECKSGSMFKTALWRAAVRVQSEATKLAARRTGHLAKTIALGQPEFDGTTASIAVGTPAKYGPFLEWGTGLFGPLHHLIYPRTAKALMWVSNEGSGRIGKRSAGHWREVTIVKSTKGMKAQPFMQPAIDSVQGRLGNDISTELKRNVDEITQSGFQGVD